MKKRLLTLIPGFGVVILLGAGLFFASAAPASGAEIFTVNMTAAGAIKQDLAFGMDDTATEGYDDNLDEPAPPAAPGGAFIGFSINGDVPYVGRDFRPEHTSEVWTLLVTLPPGKQTTLSWTLPAGNFLDDKTLEFHDGGTVLDMKTQDSVVISQSGTFSIVYKAPAIANLSPVALDDAATMWASENSVDINVLDNDYDVDGGTLSVTSVSNPSHGTAALSGNIVQYTPEAGFSGSDSFTYEISDGQGGTASATVTVTVEAGHVLGKRSHTAYAIPGTNLTVTLHIKHDGSLHSLLIQEDLPASDEQPVTPWQYVAGSFSGPGGRGAAVSQSGNTLTIDFGTDVPNSPFEVSYQVAVPATDVNQKFFSGSLVYTLESEAPDYAQHTAFIPQTSVQPGVPYHSADYDQNWKIDFNELLRVIGYYNAGGYHSQPGNGLDGFAPNPGTISGAHHSADYHGAGGSGTPPDGVIEFDELLRVIGYYNAGAYHVQADNGLDGYAPGAN